MTPNNPYTAPARTHLNIQVSTQEKTYLTTNCATTMVFCTTELKKAGSRMTTACTEERSLSAWAKAKEA